MSIASLVYWVTLRVDDRKFPVQKTTIGPKSWDQLWMFRKSESVGWRRKWKTYWKSSRKPGNVKCKECVVTLNLQWMWWYEVLLSCSDESNSHGLLPPLLVIVINSINFGTLYVLYITALVRWPGFIVEYFHANRWAHSNPLYQAKRLVKHCMVDMSQHWFYSTYNKFTRSSSSF